MFVPNALLINIDSFYRLDLYLYICTAVVLGIGVQA